MFSYIPNYISEQVHYTGRETQKSMQFLLTTIQENSTMKIEDFVNKRERQDKEMAASLPYSRELYIDVVIEESRLEEIFLYRVDFNKDRTFRTKEYLYKREEPEVTEPAEGETLLEEPLLPPDPLELFKEQWEQLCKEEVPTEVYATDACAVFAYVFEPLTKNDPDFSDYPVLNSGREFIHDCISMGRVVSMSSFDEEQYLSAGIRRRMKERYHEYVDEVKSEHKEHIFISQTLSGEMPVLLLFITDADFKIKKQVMLNRGMKEETLAVRFREILALYPEADVIADATTQELYHLFGNMNRFMGVEDKRMVFSLESMLTALGKKPQVTDIVKTYLLYIRNQEEMRLGTFLPERLYSTHEFYLPVQISSEKAWKKQFAKNSVWKKTEEETYGFVSEEDFKGKYLIKAGKEQFVLKLRGVSVQRYLKKYAVLRLETENYCYPGEADRERINELASCLFAGTSTGPDSLEIKIKNGKQAYSLTTVPVEGNENQLWLNGLLMLGHKKKKSGKKALVLSTMKEKMYCVEALETLDEEQIIQTALIKDAILRKIEDALAMAMKSENNDFPAGGLAKQQERTIKDLYEKYRYMVVSFGENYEASQKQECKFTYDFTEENLETSEVADRLREKFGLFF